ncbi:replication protein B (plasmid) [Fulvitalea axinellae]|uniref:Replication protein B n=1 Tax=Fulvitalea axinellae TaxID=1182444 RepID=A0AAU9CVY0_9BACT|nr:replication protein B [Fulvitalea axinellae]
MPIETVKKVTLIQPNQVTNAKYSFSKIQKNILYHVISELQPRMTKGEVKMEETKITLKLRDIDTNRNYQRVIDECKKMMRKQISYVLNKDNGKSTIVLATTVAAVTHDHGSEEISFILPSYAMPFFCYYGALGFTSYQKVLALSLKSTYSKRFYELCNRWKDKGGFTIPLKELREMLELENKYPKISHFRARVMDPAQKELQEVADVWFEYELSKFKSRSYNRISFKIFQRNAKGEAVRKDPSKATKKEKYSYVVRFLYLTFPAHHSNKAVEITDALMKMKYLDEVYSRFMRLERDLNLGKKNRADIERVTRFILKEDFELE